MSRTERRSKTFPNKRKTKMVRFILNLGSRHNINCDIVDSLNMFNIEARVKHLRLNHVFNIVQGLVPNYLQENVTLVSSISRYSTRSSSNRNFNVPQISTYEAGTFYYSAIKDWTGLPVNIKEIINNDTFVGLLHYPFWLQLLSALLGHNFSTFSTIFFG